MAVELLKRIRARLDVTSLVAAIGLLGIFLTIAGSAIFARMEYSRRFDDIRAQLRSEDFFLTDHANRLFEVARVALKGSSALTVGLDWDGIASSTELSRQMTSLVRAIPYIEDVWFNDETGELRATTFDWPAPKSNAADRENFKAAKLPIDDLFIGPRIVGRVTHKPTFLLSSRLENPDGSFRGMVSATAGISYFNDYWSGIALPYDARVTLARAPMAEVVAQFPDQGLVQPDGLAEQIAELPASGSYSSQGEDERFGQFRRVGDHPLYLSVDVSRSAVVAGWQQWLLRMLALPAIAVVLLAILTGLAIRDARREQNARRSLAVANNELTFEMTRRERAEDQVRQLQKIEAIGQLTGGIAHDFNNMLAIIVSSLNLIERRLQRGDTDIGKYVSAAQEGAQRAASLTQRLLAFARKQPLSPQTIDPNRFVAGMSELLQRTLTEAIQIETVLGAGLWKTHADPAQLENALLNLAVNARDSMPEGGKLTIDTANASLDPGYASEHAGIPAGQYVLIAVTDTGSGMTPEVASRVFEPFFTTKAVGKGSGLGLSQVYGFVRQSGGHVKIYSEVGQGTTVKIYLPRYYGSDAEAGQERSASVLVPGVPGEVVLLVEDEPEVRRLTVDALRELGYTVVHVDRAAAALDIVQSDRRIDLFFTDIVMPEMNGRQLAEMVLAVRPGLKILYMTGYTRNAVVHNGLLDPGVRLLGKPFSMEQLAASVRGAIDG
ncbi:hybrid sensor histidine kinase/response regulator [Kaistia algarum]|uniref:hybrid sensor histidine kinase/response regulator n=1 Tax=Kaistia algarum TaxID=2083279 RepID=UPI00225537AF|nr:hybrid sensor histidine kinase/response regulator [Kaistia algarum]MCX5515536.1 ATP-binding protein [Kaistia algarum]